jgi:hypothetical protein
MMNDKNILEEIKQKYSDLLVTNQEDIKRIGSWVSGDSPNNPLWDEPDETQVLLDSPDWSAEILTFPELHKDRCFVSVRYKRGGLREIKVLDDQEYTIEEVSKILEDKEMIKKALAYEVYHDQMLKPKRFDGDIVITDPAYIMGSDWDNDPDMDIYNGFGFDKVFGDTYIYGSTIYGDWSCTIYDCGNQDPKKIIEEAETKRLIPVDLPELGRFCADTGLVSVTYLEKSENIKKYGSHCWTCIPDFHGTVQYYLHNDIIYIVGMSDSGDHNFVSFQTGL